MPVSGVLIEGYVPTRPHANDQRFRCLFFLVLVKTNQKVPSYNRNLLSP